MSRTDAEGSSLFKVVPNTVYYKFYITHPTKGTLSTNYFKLTSSSKIFQISPGGDRLTNLLLYTNNTGALIFNDATDTFSLNWLDTTGAIYRGALKVVQTNKYGVQSVVSYSDVNASTGSIVYTITDTDNATYAATGTLETTSTTLYYSAATDTRTTYTTLGLAGIFFAFILTLFAIFLVGSSAEGVILVSIGGILVMAILGYIAGTWMVLSGIIIVGVVMIYKFNKVG